MIEKYKLKPESTSLFINAITNMACNFPQYPVMAKQMFRQHSQEYDKVRIFATEFDMRSMPYEVIYDVYIAYLLGGFLRKMACKIRPYEIVPGQTDKVIEKGHQALIESMVNVANREQVFRDVVDELKSIPVHDTYGSRPKVAIIGDMYVRDNSSFNQNLIRDLEQFGAEVLTTPLSYMIRMIGEMHNYGLKSEGRYFNLMRNKILLEVLENVERRYFQIANNILDEEFPVYDHSILDKLKKYKLTLKHGGETAQNIIKIYNMIRHENQLALIIHVNPIFCCAGLVSESFFQTVEKDIGIPIVSIVYDGTKTRRNDALEPYLHFIRKPKTETTIT
jgi:predicted nucleotide-binding protein (sugar kinase/HSP70/actin superfamily)